MSAQEQMRAMLDQLMGTARDGKLRSYSEIKNNRVQPSDDQMSAIFIWCAFIFRVFAGWLQIKAATNRNSDTVFTNAKSY